MASPTNAPARCATGTGAKSAALTNTVAPVDISKISFMTKPAAQSATRRLRRDSIVRSRAKSAESMPESPR